jgi:hypothetical protein
MRTFVALGIGLVWVSRALAADTPEGLDFFEKKIRPVLVEHCYGCHSAAAMFPMGGLMLDSAPGIRRVITPGAPEKSLLIAAIRREGKLQMPPGSTLAAEHVADFEAWIKMGAPDRRGACGCNSDYPVPDAYRYRNWMIRAFNEDKFYDQFLREQIAGDLLPARMDSSGEENTEDRYAKIVATGYLAIARRFGSHNNEFHLTIEDTIDNVGKTMLWLSVACARCHDHKVDPIPQRDYYALYGIFQSTRYAFPSTEIYQHAKDFVALAPKKAADRLKAYQDETSQLDDRLQAFADAREGKELSAEEKARKFSE